MNLTEAAKRLVIGRKLASHQLGETLLPKRIALPVFASDALSSVAYAPDEILLTLSLAGMSAFAFSWKIGLLVAAAMLVVVASYRQTVHAHPSGGGDYVVATVTSDRRLDSRSPARLWSTTRSRWRSRFLPLIRLYVVGGFVSFTVSQTGMMRHWTRHLKIETDPLVRRQMMRSRVINAIGLSFTGVVLVIVLISKFTHGAYLAIIAMVVVFFVMKTIKRHYDNVAHEVELQGTSDSALPSRVRAIILVSDVNKPTARAVAFARAMRPTTLEAVIVSVDPAEVSHVITEWEAQDYPVRLKVLASPFREVTNPFVAYVKSVRSANPRDVVCVFVPEYVVGHWWEQLLHNQTALVVRTRLHFTPGIMVISVPYQLHSSQAAVDRLQREDPLAWRPIGTGLSQSEMDRVEEDA